MSTIKTQIQALARLQAIATTFYVYHKVKGDRAGGPDYDLLKTFTDKAKADKFASDYNDQKGYKAGKGMHSAVVRTTKIKEESSTKVQADVDQEDAIDIIVDVFNDNGLAIKFSKILDGDPNFLVFSFANPITGKQEKFLIELFKKELIFDGLGSESFGGGDMLEMFIKSSPDMLLIKKSSAKKFQKWANDTHKACVDITQKLDKYNKFATALADSIISLQTMVAMNKFINRRKKDMKKTFNDQAKRNAKAK